MNRTPSTSLDRVEQAARILGDAGLVVVDVGSLLPRTSARCAHR